MTFSFYNKILTVAFHKTVINDIFFEMNMIIKRDKYLDELIGWKHTDLIKIVTGLRRCGKSFL